MSRPTVAVGSYIATGYQMIESIDIRNYRCFESLRVEGCKRINVIVGDNGSGKTALLEALFIALCSGTEPVHRMRMLRGLDHPLGGTLRAVEEAIWSDFFTNLDTKRTISIQLDGHGPERRSLFIERGRSRLTIPLNEPDQGKEATAPLTFTWRDSAGFERSVSPKVTRTGVSLEDTGEDLPDFFFYAAGQQISVVETAQRFSDLKGLGRQQQFVSVFTKEYDWIEDLGIEVKAGAPVIHAKIKGLSLPLSINNASGAINRLINVLLSVGSRPRSVVLVDEVENGVYYKHHLASASALISFARTFDGQLFLSTHSEEWMEAAVEAAGSKVDDMALWRIERGSTGPIIRQFSGDVFKAGIEGNGELR